MGCCSGDREKGPKEESQKWDFITLSDFRCTSAWTYVAYGWLWLMVIVGVAVYVVDTFTAINLLAFNKWSSQIQPAVPFKYSKWIFSICICISWALCFYEWMRAIRVIRRGGVAESFLDPLALDIQSMRPQGWKRFLVFSELTKSKKGADYVALFAYFSFKTAIRVILAEGPRQAVNAMTLYAVLQADLIPGRTQTEHNNFDQFWINIDTLAKESAMQAALYFSMLFTLVIWVFSALSLIISAVLYLFFLWHYIPQHDGNLNTYCRRKIDKRLARVVSHKVQAAIEEEARRARKAEEKAERKAQKMGEIAPSQIGIKKQPTLPNLKDDKFSEFGSLKRQDTDMTTSTLPPYSSAPPTRNNSESQSRQPTLPDVAFEDRPNVSRANTAASTWTSASYATNAPLLDNAGYPGESEPPLPRLPPSAMGRQDSYASSFQQPWHERSNSQRTQGSFGDGPMRPYTPASRGPTPMGGPRAYTPVADSGPQYPRVPPMRKPTPMRSNTGMSYDQDPQSATSIRSQDSFNRPYPPPSRSNTADGYDTQPYTTLHSQQSFSRPMPKSQPSSSSFSRPLAPPLGNPDAPISQGNSFEMTIQPSHSVPPPVFQTPAPQSAGGYVAFNPYSQSSTPAPDNPTLQSGPRRNITVAGTPGVGDSYFGNVKQVPQRSATAPMEAHRVAENRASVNDILDGYGDEQQVQRLTPASNPVQQRSHTVGPAPGSQSDWRQFA